MIVTILFVLEADGEWLNRSTLMHAVMQIDLDDLPDCNSCGSQRDQGDPCGGGEQDEHLQEPWRGVAGGVDQAQISDLRLGDILRSG